MSIYDRSEERAIRVARLVDDWTTSGLLGAEQRAHVSSELQVDLRRTNRFLRLTLFVFGALIILSTVGLVITTIGPQGEAAGSALCIVGAIACYGLAGFLVDRYRLYRFGVEESAAVAAVVLTAAAMALAFPDWPVEAGLVGGAVAALGMFLKFGYLYAAIASMVCLSLLPFQFGDLNWLQHSAAAVMLAAIATSARRQRVTHGDDHPGDTYGFIEAIAWFGIYAVINLQFSTGLKSVDASSWFYWVTYAGIWMVPPVGLWLGIRDRQRPLIDAGLLMVLATLMSNKSYLAAERYAWDPIVFGLLLMGTAIGVRRWLASGAHGMRAGFTPSRVLASDQSMVGVVGIASAAVPGVPVTSTGSTDAIGGGGRSGGAGASGSF